MQQNKCTEIVNEFLVKKLTTDNNNFFLFEEKKLEALVTRNAIKR